MSGKFKKSLIIFKDFNVIAVVSAIQLFIIRIHELMFIILLYTSAVAPPIPLSFKFLKINKSPVAQ